MAWAKRSARTTGGRVRSSLHRAGELRRLRDVPCVPRAAFYAVGPYLSPLASPYFETKGLGIRCSPPRSSSCLPRALPLHLLLLPEGVLPLVRDDAAGLRGRRGAPGAYNGERQAAPVPEPAPVRDVLRAPVPRLPLARLHQVAVVRGPRSLRARLPRDLCKLHVPLALHDELPLVPSPRRRQREQLLRAPFGMLRHKLWSLVSQAEHRPHVFAWISLFGVALCDFYIRSVASARSPTSNSSDPKAS